MTMTLNVTAYLRKVLLADAAVSGAAAVLMIAGAGILGPILALPASLIFWAGIVLVPFVALLFAVARRETVSRMVMADIVIINMAWVIASFGIMIAGLVEPNLLGVLFISAQALAVALLTVLQYAGLRSASTVAA